MTKPGDTSKQSAARQPAPPTAKSSKAFQPTTDQNGEVILPKNLDRLTKTDLIKLIEAQRRSQSAAKVRSEVALEQAATELEAAGKANGELVREQERLQGELNAAQEKLRASNVTALYLKAVFESLGYTFESGWDPTTKRHTAKVDVGRWLQATVEVSSRAEYLNSTDQVAVVSSNRSPVALHPRTVEVRHGALTQTGHDALTCMEGYATDRDGTLRSRMPEHLVKRTFAQELPTHATVLELIGITPSGCTHRHSGGPVMFGPKLIDESHEARPDGRI